MADEKVELTTVVVDDGNKEVATETATEAPKTDVTTPATTEAKKTPGQTIKGFFSRAKTPKTPADTTDGPTENNTETTITEPVKKEKKTPGAQWFARKPHLPKFISPTVENGGPTQPQMTCGLNLIDRDEKKINETVTVSLLPFISIALPYPNLTKDKILLGETGSCWATNLISTSYQICTDIFSLINLSPFFFSHSSHTDTPTSSNYSGRGQSPSVWSFLGVFLGSLVWVPMINGWEQLQLQKLSHWNYGGDFWLKSPLELHFSPLLPFH